MAENNLDIIVCAICQNNFTEPKLLNCFHTFCKTCLEGLVKNLTAFSKGFNCPLCREWIRIPKGGVKNFQRNIYIRDDSRLRIDCDRCQSEAINLCINCGHACCEKCRKDHVSSGYSKHHRIKKLSELSFTDALKIKQKTFCSVHTAEAVKLVCLDCKRSLLCHVCASTEHKSHKTTDISSTAADERLRVSTELKDCEEFLEKSKIEFRQRVVNKQAQQLDLEYAISELERKKREVISSIESKFKHDVKQIKSHQSIFLREAIRHINKEDMSISKFQHGLEKIREDYELKNDIQILMKKTGLQIPWKLIFKGIPQDVEYRQIKENINKWDACLQNMKQLSETTQIHTMRKGKAILPIPAPDRPRTPLPNKRT